MVNLLCDSAKTIGSLNPESVLEQAVSLLKQAETVYLFGVGASGIVVEDLHQKLVRINKR